MPDPDTGKIVFLRPDPRAILPLDGFHASRSLRRKLRHGTFRVTYDEAFKQVMVGCSSREETWITEDFFEGYGKLHELGHAHSVEVWNGEKLVGGLYGVALGGAFFAESKFHTETDASKVALFHLVDHLRHQGFTLLEVQFQTPHLKSLGVVEVPDETYQALLQRALTLSVAFLPVVPST